MYVTLPNFHFSDMLTKEIRFSYKTSNYKLLNILKYIRRY